MNCKNCSHPISGKYCSNCGQIADTQRYNFKTLSKDLRKTFLRLDSDFIRTIKQLFVNPGMSLHNYLQGKRVDFIPPFSFVILIAGLNIIVHDSFDIAWLQDMDGSQEQKLQNNFIANNFTKFQLLILPIYAFFSLILFGKNRYNFYEYLIVHCYLVGQRLFLNLFFIPLAVLATNTEWSRPLVVINVAIGQSLIILTFSLLFKEKNAFLNIFKGLLLCLLSLATLGFILYFAEKALL